MKAPALDSLKAVKPNLLIAVLALLAAAWFAWQGAKASSVEALNAKTGEVRADVARQIGENLQAAVARLDASRVRIALATALKRGEQQNAHDVVAKDWSGIEAVEWHEPGLDAAYADPATFGYGKLGILEAALQRNETQAAVVKDAGGPRLGLGAPVVDEGKVLTLVYVRLPLEALTAPLQSASLEGGYLALRQGQHSVVETGDAELAKLAEVGAVTIPGTQMRVVAAAPAGDAGLGAGVNYLLAVLSLIVAIGLFLLPRLRGLRIERRPDDVEPAVEPTMAEIQSRSTAEATVATAVEKAAPAPQVRRAARDRAYRWPSIPSLP